MINYIYVFPITTDKHAFGFVQILSLGVRDDQCQRLSQTVDRYSSYEDISFFCDNGFTQF